MLFEEIVSGAILKLRWGRRIAIQIFLRCVSIIDKKARFFFAIVIAAIYNQEHITPWIKLPIKVSNP